MAGSLNAVDSAVAGSFSGLIAVTALLGLLVWLKKRKRRVPSDPEDDPPYMSEYGLSDDGDTVDGG
jgi:hypothetical protein